MSALALPALTLLLPVVLGVVAGASSLFREPERAIDALNRYALYVAFPALIAGGLLRSELALPSSPGFWLTVPLVLALTVLSVRLVLPGQSATIALIVAFGNVAYLGLPVAVEVLGARALPLAALATTVHVLLALTVGPALLLRWSGREAGLGRVFGRIARHPLLWGPAAGIALRVLPMGWRASISSILEPLGSSAAPVALFLLGIYLWLRRARVRAVDAGDLAHVVVKLALMPALTFALVWLFRRQEAIEPLEAQVLVLLASMPAAITTFSIAHDYGIGVERVSRAIVTTTLAWLLTVLAVIAALEHLA